MTIVSSRQLGGAVMRADVCVVGCGAAGIALAVELDRAGLEVLVLDAGGRRPQCDLDDERWSVEHLGTPWRNPEPSRGFGIGGSANYWFARLAVPDPIDLRERSWVPHSGWPIGYDELWPWLRDAAALLEAPPVGLFDPGAWLDDPTAEMIRAEPDAGLGVFLWAGISDLRSGFRSRLQRSDNVTVLLDATAVELVSSDHGIAVSSIRARGSHGENVVIEAQRFVLAAGGLENARLLLSSTAHRSSGLGNDHDLVGRFYQDHPRAEGSATLDLTCLSPEQRRRFTMLAQRSGADDRPVQLVVTFAPELQEREQLLNHALHAYLVAPTHETDGFASLTRLRSNHRRAGTFSDVATTVRAAPDLVAHGLRYLAGRVQPTRVVFVDQMEQVPNRNSRVTIDLRRRDRWGLPRLQLDWQISESTIRSQHRMHIVLRDVLARAGIPGLRSTVLDPAMRPPPMWDMKHPAGTTRMARHPKDGVVDPDLRVHGIDNLYVVGSSVFPTTGHFNPTLAIVALAMRLAERLRTAAQ